MPFLSKVQQVAVEFRWPLMCCCACHRQIQRSIGIVGQIIQILRELTVYCADVLHQLPAPIPGFVKSLLQSGVTSFTLAAQAASDADLAASAICGNRALSAPVSMVVVILHSLQVVGKGNCTWWRWVGSFASPTLWRNFCWFMLSKFSAQMKNVPMSHPFS